MIATGTPDQLWNFLFEPAGKRFAVAKARAIFEDEDALTAFELGEAHDLHPVIAAALDRLIANRNTEDPA